MRVFLLAFLFPFLAVGQQVILSVPPHLTGSTVRLIAYEGLHERMLDSVYVENQELMLSYSISEDGMAKILLNDDQLTELILTKESTLKGTIGLGAGTLDVEWTESNENDAFQLLLSLSGQYSGAVEKLSELLENIPQFHPQRETINDSLQSQYRTLLSAYNASLAALKSKYPETYTAQVLVGLDALPMREDKPQWLEEFDNDPAFLHRHFFENVRFDDGRTATNPYLKNKILEYIFTYIEKHEQGLKNAIDLIMSKADRDEEVKKACAEILIGFLTDQGLSEYVDYLNQEHLSSCSIDFDPTIGKILKRSSPYRVGDMVKSAAMTDAQLGEINLVDSEKEFNVLMFWASWCSHCHEEIPQLENFISLNMETLEVKGVSIDTLASDLRSANKSFPTLVKQFCDLKGWNSNPAEQFGISATPSFILLRKNGEYLGRASSLVNLAMLLAEQQH